MSFARVIYKRKTAGGVGEGRLRRERGKRGEEKEEGGGGGA